MFACSTLKAATPDAGSAVIFVYQHVGDDGDPQNNLSLEQFQEHMRELSDNGYSVLPVPEILSRLKDTEHPLPPKTIGLTFDGAYVATLKNIVPLLEDARFPFTVFFASDMVDDGTSNYASWSDLKSLKKNKLVTLGILPSNYTRLVDKKIDDALGLINKAVARYREIFYEAPAFFAYPYGEYSDALKKALTGYNFSGVFGQQSGAMSAASDLLALPRFTLTDEFGDLDRFVLTANALPLIASDITPDDPVIGAQNPPLIGFTLDPSYTDTSRLSCFASGFGKIDLTRLGKNRIEIRLPTPLDDRYTRINCTMPSATSNGGWYWLGMRLIRPDIHENSDTPDTTVDIAPEENASPSTDISPSAE